MTRSTKEGTINSILFVTSNRNINLYNKYTLDASIPGTLTMTENPPQILVKKTRKTALYFWLYLKKINSKHATCKKCATLIVILEKRILKCANLKGKMCI